MDKGLPSPSSRRIRSATDIPKQECVPSTPLSCDSFFYTFFQKNVFQHSSGTSGNPFTFTNSIPFTFTGKERDEETGFSYFGARYYDSDLSGLFLSVDPMSNKYPGISPYAYCAWNPVKLVDPDGKEAEDPPSKFNNIGLVIPKSDFVEWGHGDLEMNCNVYAKEQMRIAGYSVGGGEDKTNIKPYNEKTGSNEAEFNKAVNYIKSCLENGIPVFVGVDDQAGASNTDNTTDHFIVIVGMGYDEENGNYFTAYDNATRHTDEGTSNQNRLYVDYENKRIQSKGRFPNGYAIYEATRPYTVTQVRQSRKKKK